MFPQPFRATWDDIIDPPLRAGCSLFNQHEDWKHSQEKNH